MLRTVSAFREGQTDTTRLDHRWPVRDLRNIGYEVQFPIHDATHSFQDIFSLPRRNVHHDEIGRRIRHAVPLDRLRDLPSHQACVLCKKRDTHVIGRIEIPNDFGMKRLCPHRLGRRGKQRLDGGGLEMQRTRNLTDEHVVVDGGGER